MSEAQSLATRLREQAGELRLHGLLGRWAEVMSDPEQARWVAQLLGWEATERHRRSLERRLRAAHIGRFKSLADFDWKWPTQCDRPAVESLMTLDFLKDASNIVLVGPNGVGKTMCACNIGYQAVLAGYTALFITAGQLLGELAALACTARIREGHDESLERMQTYAGSFFALNASKNAASSKSSGSSRICELSIFGGWLASVALSPRCPARNAAPLPA